tara:strand:- start:887 stop:1033 length:147 start_codon:yes stop_codon:yes gene_type:complete
MKFLLQYDKPKKKGFSKQKATFFDVRDAMLFERHVKSQGAINTEIRPL